ncbi:unnamed protein product [Effrenium voratum]|nr:unnamed protein product [Effrenium voratum]
MAGLYDDLPEPQSDNAQQLLVESEQRRHSDDAFDVGPRPEDAGASRLFALDDVTLQQIWGFLALPDVGNSLPAVCPLLKFLRGAWAVWQRFAAPLCRTRIQIMQLLHVHSRSLPELALLSESLGEAVDGFQGFRPRLPSFAPDLHALSYCELPIPRVVWSLHNEGLSKWRTACASVVNAEFALLPPWDRPPRRNFLPRKVHLLLGVSLWLPPQQVEAEHSFPVLYMNVALLEPAVFESLAERHPGGPPCLAATCEALLLRLDPGLRSSALEDDWSWRFCFGPEGYRHTGHGETEGYRCEVQSAGRRRWRPPELCFARVEEKAAQSLRVLLRCRRCVGLLE